MSATPAFPDTRARSGDWRGIAIAAVVICLWGSLLMWLLRWPLIGWMHPLKATLILVAIVSMTHLYTGLFITAHDAMHGALAPGRPWLNNALGRLCTLLFAFNSWARLHPKHHAHHRHVASLADPDFHPAGKPGFWPWYAKFVTEYVTVPQLLAMAVAFNVLYRIFFPPENVILFWMLPAVLSTFQLFYFGTYLPHRSPPIPANAHHSHSLPQNHVWAFVSCYFFGYHYEHHDSPATPWWLLWRQKEAQFGVSTNKNPLP